MESEIYIMEKPQDGISRVKFAHKSDSLLVTSWDSHAYFYDGVTSKLKSKFNTPYPLLDGDYCSDT